MKSGEKWVCLKDSNVPNHTHNVVRVTDNNKNTLDDNSWICANKGGKNLTMVNVQGDSDIGVSNQSIEYQISQLEYNDCKTHVVKPHDNMPPYMEVYIWECVEGD